jgi:hypothetical protein
MLEDRMKIIERESTQEMKSISQEFISDIATLKLTREVLSAIIGSHMEFTADLKIYYKLLKNDRKINSHNDKMEIKTQDKMERER